MTRCKAALAFCFVVSGACAVADPAAAAALRLDMLAATRARPLFAPTRRPPLPPQAPEPAAMAFAATDSQAAPPNLRLVGVVYGSTIKKALVQRVPNLETIGVVMGEEIDGWEVTRIELRQIVLSRAEQSVMMALGAPDK